MTPDTSVYTDLQGFASLRAQAQKDPDAALDQVAKQFESIFTQMMVKSMREASEPLESDWAGSSQMKSYQQMFDQQLSLDLSNRGGLGLAQIIASQLGGAANSQSASGDAQTTGEAISNLASYHRTDPPAVAPKKFVELTVAAAGAPSTDAPANSAIESKSASLQPIDTNNELVAKAAEKAVPAASTESKGVSSDDDHSWLPETPAEFVDSLWGLAKKAGEALGQSPKVILAQAALETGWGKFIIRNADGSNSFNLFGIKGGSRWSGSEARVSTLEYIDSVAERQMANFRSYDSLADAFGDYVEFLSGSPRYEKALSATDESGFLAGLEEGGYATDPNYAQKILSILNRSEFQEIDNQLKNSTEGSL